MGDDTEKDTLTLTSVRKNIWQNFLRKFMTYDDSGVRILTDKRNEEPIDNIWSISRSMVDQIEEEIASTRKKAKSILMYGLTSGFIGIIYLIITTNLLEFFINFRLYNSSSTFIEIILLLIIIKMEIFFIYSLYIYNKKLDLIKYYRNEITNLLTNLTAIELCTIYRDADMVRNLIIRLSQIDRNNSLKKSNPR